MLKDQPDVSQHLRESRRQLKLSIESLQSDLRSELGSLAPKNTWLLPLCAAGIGLVAAWALRARLTPKKSSSDL